MKKTFLLALLLMILGQVQIHAQLRPVSIQQAYGLLQSIYGTSIDSMNVSVKECSEVINRPISRNDMSSYMYYVLTRPKPYWIFFVDEEPLKGWEHNCACYYIPQNLLAGNSPLSNHYYKVELNMPPAESGFTSYHVSSSNSLNGINIINVSESTFCNPNAAHTYAVILSGGAYPQANRSRYWNDCSFIYQTLTKKYKIPKSHIYSLISDGTSPGIDIDDWTTDTHMSSPLDFDGDSVADINYAATFSNVQQVMTELADSMTEEDQLFFYVIDHGGHTPNYEHSFIWLWDSDSLYDYQLKNMVDNITAKNINFVLGQCYSGGFVDDLQGANRTIATASAYNESSWACSNYQYDEFVYHWTCAMSGTDANLDSISADVNGDFRTSMLEAYNYAEAHDIRYETPQFSSSPNHLAQNIAFDGNFVDDYDLYISDFEGDVGLEMPDGKSLPIWNSPDIWIRNQTDGDVVFETEPLHVVDEDQDFYTYVRVHNRGTKDYLGGAFYVHLFWADASVGLDYNTWAGNNNGNNSGNTFTGGPCRTTGRHLTDTIAAGESRVIRIKWTLPEELLDNIIANGGYFHICHLVTITNNPNSIHSTTWQDMTDGTAYVKRFQKRWIAQENATFYNSPAAASQGLPLVVRNTFGEEREVNIEILPSDRSRAAMNKTEVAVKLPQALYKAWNTGGRKAQKAMAYVSAPEKVYLQACDSKIQDIRLDAHQADKMVCYFNVIADEDITEDTYYEFNIIQRDKLTGEIMDGENVRILMQPRHAIKPEVVTTVGNDGVVLEERNVSEAARYEWYDETGMKVAEGKKVTIKPNSKIKTYRLKVIAEKDGAVNYASASMEPKATFGIESIAPLPIGSQLTIRLTGSASANTKIRITSASDPTVSEVYTVKQGEREMTLFTSQFDKGVCLVTLLKDGKVVDSRKVMHE